MKIYTKTGDDGTTSLQGNIRIKKSDLRIRAYGTVDELNAFLGVINSKLNDKELITLTTSIQNDLFVLGADLSNPDTTKSQNRISSHDIERLENYIDRFEANLTNITYFILPGGTEIASNFHFARAIARRAESLVVALAEKSDINKKDIQYLN
ncbi:MAG: cob(I)yrinic acid a,c-diamide adenosyltransferase, partial [Nitrosopumilaceae archaeon]|nr:cob(I)yrinic acid a,c-diamide adenosyltransferase [Nitrosopumilaceae archaeon]NIU02002.1 cob(I)yrinic acid a,c-diamide adenosyltransferase [Nitrosopumilaceae archaeon]NIU87153.1 cob(I)yrinic acid a,c-diamide adenosyltransferase [Nitrosopumilaceae archaeon]NIV64643.1 cob(I)yrinic acid a,c-diamide adenosyltransferase [Nitrosopumilaceae archaeon]NIX62603.1 cob(I)yrinic acid a,c-diamide adenosyltransferase [Nitrosopumilaceae archaeon]